MSNIIDTVECKEVLSCKNYLCIVKHQYCKGIHKSLALESYVTDFAVGINFINPEFGIKKIRTEYKIYCKDYI